MEIMGLMVIVVLLVIGALFYVKFVVLQPKTEGASDIIGVQAYNLMNSILNVKVCGNNVSIRNAIGVCKNNGDLCGENACNYIEKELEGIIKVSMPKDYSEYGFIAGKPLQNSCEEAFLEVKEGGCKYGVASPRYINVEYDYCIVLKLCRKNIK